MGIRVVVFILLLLASCTASNQTGGIRASDNAILFMVFSIKAQPTGNTIQLVSKTISAGKVKKHTNGAIHGSNYLSFCFYDGQKLVDSQAVAHPLYKHLEYTDANNAFAFKDTIVGEAQFFIRAQPSGNVNQLRVVEYLKDEAPKQLAVLKL